MGQPPARQICERLEEAQRGLQQETQGYPTRKRQSPARTEATTRGGRATTKPLLGPDEKTEEKNSGQTKEDRKVSV